MDAADPATFAALKPRVAVMNNGAQKGGGADTFAALHNAPGVAVWQLHRSTNAGARNFDDTTIANLDESHAFWIKMAAREDGSFAMTNARTGETKTYSR